MDKTYATAAVFLAVLSTYNTYMLHTLSKELDDKVITLTNSIDSVKVNTDGKLQDLDEGYKKLASIGNTTVIQKEITYVPKESKDDADVELTSSKPKVTVKVNGGPKYSFDTFTDESTKFDSGKLQINTATSYKLDITADDYPRSKWSVTGAVNADKKVIGSLNYDLGHSTSLTAMAGQGIKPYYGLTFRIGSHK